MISLLALVYSLLVFLFPVGLYCLVLSYLNRSARPVLVPGIWDGVGLLFALSGFILWTAPGLLDVGIGRIVDYLPGSGAPATLRTWVTLLRVSYFAAVALVAAWLLWGRRHQTDIYNVETDLFRPLLRVALTDLGLQVEERAGRLLLTQAETKHAEPAEAIRAGPPIHAPAVAPTNGSADSSRRAELTIETFPAFCHATLRWDQTPPSLRAEIERQLPRALEGAVAADNPAAGWFLGFSGLTFFLSTLLAMFFVTFMLWRGR